MHICHALVIESFSDNVLRKHKQFAGTWAEFIQLVGKHEAGPKDGRALIPFCAEWLEGEDRQPRAGAHERPGARWTVLSLDLDACTDTQLEDAHQRLLEAGVSYLLHSTHSYDPNGRMKARLYTPVDCPLTELEVPSAKIRLASWLGLETDKATKGGHTLFFTPRAPTQELVEAAFILSAVGRPVQLAELPPAPVQAPSPARFKTVAAAVRPMVEWPEQVKARAQETLDWLCRAIASHAKPHLRTDLLHPMAPVVGGFAGSGLLDRDTCLERLETAIDERAERYSYDDHDVEERIEDLNKLFDHGYDKPLVPHGYDPKTGELDLKTAKREKLRGRDYVNAMLADQTPDRLYTAQESGDAMHAFLRKPRYAIQPWLGLVEVSTGAGKTWAIRQLAAERAAAGEYTIILSLDHALLGQIRRDLEAAGVPARQLHSVMQPTSKTGGPECQRRLDPDIQLLAKSGANVLASACGKCPFRSTCEALKYKRRVLSEHVVLAPYEMADYAIDKVTERKDSPGAPLVVCDEEPPGPSEVTVTMAELEEARDSSCWGLLRDDQASNAVALVHSLLDNLPPPHELVEGCQSYYGQLHMTGLSVPEERANRQPLDTVKRVLQMALGWDTRVLMKDRWRAQVPQRAWRALREHGGYILSATPNYALYDNIGIEVDSLLLRVVDHTQAERKLVYVTHGTRSKITPMGEYGREVDWAIVEQDLEALLGSIPADAKTVIGTFMAVSNGLQGDMKHLLLGRDVELIHFEVVRGRDDWKEHDVFVSLYDPLVPPPMKVLEKSGGRKILVPDWLASKQHAARSLSQFHGRARDPQPRARGALHMHYGSVPPSDWSTGNTEVVEPDSS